MKRLIYLFMFLVICISASAEDINILTYREDYRPLETFQAEIIFDKEPLNELNILNFEFYKDEPVGILLSLEKLNNNRYFAYFNIPNVKNGEYKFKAKNINIIDNGILKRISKEVTINIKDKNKGFNYLLNNQENDGSFGDIIETSLGALALKNINNEKANLAVSYLLDNQDHKGCYPKDNCKIKETSFALLSLKEFNQNYIKTKNWLKDASNNFELGVWNLRLEGNAVCGNINLNGVYDLNIENNEINITCNNNINFRLTHNYLGNSYTIYEYTGNNFYYIIDDSGCYGEGYKQKCDYISSLYSSWALKEINEDFPEDYLRENKLDNRTIDHALGYILYQDNYNKDWLLNNYYNDYWSYDSISLSQTPDYFVSALSAYALRNEFLFDESKRYLEDKTEEGILNSALILYLLFDDERNLPSVSINPGIVNKKKSFTLKIKNNKEDPIIVFIEAPNFTNLPSTINLQGEINYNINVKESFDIVINYDNYSYTIPVISSDQELNEDAPLLPPPKDAIQFVNEDVNLNLSADDSLTDDLMFINNWGFKLTDITLNITGRLKEILEFEQDYFDSIESNETLSTRIYLNKDENPSLPYYEGYLIVRSSKNTLDSLKFHINFEVEPFSNDVNETEEPVEVECETSEDCEEGEECSEEGICISKEEEPETAAKPIEKKKSLWWLWVIIILVIGVLIFIFFRRKKEITQSFDDYTKNIKR